MKKAIGYARISRDEEGSGQLSLDYQRAAIENYCLNEGLSLVGVESDQGISGKNIKARPAVQRVLSLVDATAVDAVVVYKSDRMSRDGLESLQIEKLFLRRGVSYLSVTEGDLARESVEDEFMRFIRAGLNERERKLISLRTRTALRRKRERGERIGGRPRYGWQVVDGELIPEPSEQEAIYTMTMLAAKGYSTRAIMDRLKSEGIRTRGGGYFAQTQIVRILRTAP